MQKFPLDLQTVMQTLQELQVSGILSTTTEALPNISGRWSIRLSVVAGKITSCDIRNDSIQLPVERVFPLLYQIGVLEWQWTTTSQFDMQRPSAQQAEQEHVQLSSVPRKLLSERPTQSPYSWPRVKNWVFQLINGERSVEDILALLSIDEPERMVTIITELCEEGLVTVAPAPL